MFEVIAEFLHLCRHLALEPILIQPQILQQLAKDNFSWVKFERKKLRSLSLVVLQDFDCKLLQNNFAQIVPIRQLHCFEETNGFVADSDAVTIYLFTAHRFDPGKPYYHFPSAKNFPSIFPQQDIVVETKLLSPYNLTDVDQISFNLPNQHSLEHFVDNLLFGRLVSCDSERAGRFYSENSEMRRISDSAEALEFKRIVRQILQMASVAFHEINVPFWLSSGTCLGWFRQCDVIPYARDVDIGIFRRHYKPEILDALEDKGFQLKMRLGLINDSFQLSFMFKEVKLDIYIFYEEETLVWNGATKPETGEKHKYLFPKFQLCWTDFLDLNLLLRVPCPTQPYIEANYGENFMHPVTDWRWDESPPNAQFNGKWDLDALPDAVQVFEHD